MYRFGDECLDGGRIETQSVLVVGAHIPIGTSTCIVKLYVFSGQGSNPFMSGPGQGAASLYLPLPYVRYLYNC